MKCINVVVLRFSLVKAAAVINVGVNVCLIQSRTKLSHNAIILATYQTFWCVGVVK